jgi:hypothetical protein
MMPRKRLRLYGDARIGSALRSARYVSAATVQQVTADVTRCCKQQTAPDTALHRKKLTGAYMLAYDPMRAGAGTRPASLRQLRACHLHSKQGRLAALELIPRIISRSKDDRVLQYVNAELLDQNYYITELFADASSAEQLIKHGVVEALVPQWGWEVS